MKLERKPVFQHIRRARNGDGFDLREVALIDLAIDAIEELWPFQPSAPDGQLPCEPVEPVSHLSLTPRVAMEVIGHEAIVPEAYKDSVGVWTWGIGVTSKSGHDVARYRDNPQTIDRCLDVYLWLLRERYIPDVVKAFSGFILTEAQFAAALSFHYNTGAIGRASWVTKAKAGDMAGAAKSFMDWRKPPEIVGRRTKERDLFFSGKWSQDGKATVYAVRKPSYSPDWKSARRVDVSAALERLMRP